MYESTCKNCGAPMFAEKQLDKRQFCSKRCFGAFLHMQRAKPYAGGQRIKDIHPEGYNALVRAIVSQAKSDVLTRKPESWIREDAENFFLSPYFETMTGLDGFEILYKLTQQYDEKQKKKGTKA